MNSEPDMDKVAAAVAALEARRRARENPNWSKAHAALKAAAKDHRTYPPVAPPPAQDSSIRKPLRAHGIKCSGFFHSQFLNRD